MKFFKNYDLKYSILFILIVNLNSLSGQQQKQFVINWDGTEVITTGQNSIVVPSFNEENFDFDFSKGPLFTARWNSNGNADQNSAKLSNISYEVISEKDLLEIDKAIIPSSHNLYFGNYNTKVKQSYYLELNPIIIDNGVYKRITAFTINYTTRAKRNSITSKSSNAITNSVLETGDWYRFYIEESGVYRLSRDFLNSLGLNTSSVDPRTIKLYGNGGRMIPLRNSNEQLFDVTENAIKFVGEEDGNFNNGDYILFYGEGPDQLSIESDTNVNLYTDRTYYYINVSPGNGKRIQQMPEISSTPNVVFDTFNDFQYYEIDENNIAKLGRRWFGDAFNIENRRTYQFSFPNLVTSEPINYNIFAASNSESNSRLSISVNDNVISNINFSGVDGFTTLVRRGISGGNINASSDDVTIVLEYDNGGNPSASAFLDYIRLEAERQLIYDTNTLFFRNNQLALSTGVAQFNLSNATQVSEIWDITDRFNVSNLVNTSDASTLSFRTTAGTSKEFVAFTLSNILTPIRDSATRVANQNLKGTIFNDGDVDYIIITPTSLITQARRLAEINRNQYNINVKVVELSTIYNEFSTGNKDISAIRNFVKYVYDNAIDTERLKYLCLFGDTSYDYKDRISNNNNLVPSWYSPNSYDLIKSFVSDDFFVLMEEGEGFVNANETLDLAVGRILADDIQLARQMVDKVEAYYNEESFGSWRNNVLVISDDIDWQFNSRGDRLNWERIIQETTEGLATTLETEKPFFNVERIHTDAFQQESSSAGNRYPEVNNAIRDLVDAGALVINYFGHGGEDGIATERIFDAQDSRDVNNLCRYNLFITVTCEYTKFDDPDRPTAGEYTYWNKDGGSIGLITTTRQIFVQTGIALNNILDDYLFGFSTNNTGSIAEALQNAKNDLTSQQKRLAFFIGDPAMQLAIPKPEVRLTHINDVPIVQEIDTLKALSKVNLRGMVVDEKGSPLPNYKGIITSTVYDKPTQRQTLANDGVYECTIPAPGGNLDNCPSANRNTIILDFETLGEVVFRGKATVTNGEFSVDFVVPRDIGIPLGNGKISFYAQDGSALSDQTGFNSDVLIGGISDEVVEDNEGPLINLFMNDENFVSGGITNESPTFLAKLQDSNGINTVSGIGHDISAVLDGDETNPIILNDYYEASLDDYTNGVVSYPLRDLEPGPHTITLRAWDVYNNSSTADIEFLVFDEDKGLVIKNVLNYPNPFVNYTEFWFNHNSSEPLDISVQIFTVSGKLVRTLNGQTSGGKSVSTLSKDIIWDGRDDFGYKLGKGVYIYKLKVKSERLNTQVEKTEKLVIL